MQGTYDKIVENSLSLLRGLSLDERASQLREQYKSREVSDQSGRRIVCVTAVMYSRCTHTYIRTYTIYTYMHTHIDIHTLTHFLPPTSLLHTFTRSLIDIYTPLTY